MAISDRTYDLLIIGSGTAAQTASGRVRAAGWSVAVIDHLPFGGTCARPVPLHIPGEDYVITSDRFLELDALPAQMALVGGGYIAAEFSHIAARAGARVTVFQSGERMLPAFDPDLVGWLMEKFGELGIDVRTHSAVQRIG